MSSTYTKSADLLSKPAIGRGEGLLLSFALAVFLATLPLGWVQLASVGGLKLRPMHVALLALFLTTLSHMAVSSLASWRQVWSFEFILFCCFYVAYLIALGCSLLTSTVGSAGKTSLVKYVAYFLAFAMLYTVLRAPGMGSRTIARAIYLGCPLGLFLFIGLAMFIFYRLGRNLPGELIAAVIRGDSAHLRWGIYTPLFNDPIASQVHSDVVRISLRHTLMGSFLLFIVLVWIYEKSMPRKWIAVATRWSVTGLAGLLILTSLSRSNIAAAGLVCACGLAITLVLKKDRTELSNAVTGLTLVAAVAMSGLFVVAATSSVDELFRDRFSFATLFSDSRVEMFRAAVRRIGERFMTGHGVGSEIVHDQHGSGRIHNLFLSAWYEAGLFAFVAAVAFSMQILIGWCTTFLNVVRSPDYWRLPIAVPWVLALPVLPLICSIQSGESGNFQLNEWCCLAFFFASLSENRREQTVAGQLIILRSSGNGDLWRSRK